MSSLSQGPFNHNRFSAIDEHYAREKMYFMEKAKEKKAKPDFLDVDGDGDKEESFKKGVKDKKKGGDKKDGKKDLPAFLQKKEMKESSCSSGCDCDDCKKSKKKKMDEAIVSYLMYHGYANNPVSAEIVLKHMSETWLNDVANEIHEGYKPMSKSATASSERRSSDLYNKETSSAKAGDEKKTNKAMQDRIKVDGARNRYGSR